MNADAQSPACPACGAPATDRGGIARAGEQYSGDSRVAAERAGELRAVR